MPNKCSVFGCITNYTGHKKGHVFGLPNDEDLRKRWIRFINREDITELSNLDYVFVCEDHFDKIFIKPGAKCPKLIKKLNPVPTIQTSKEYEHLPSLNLYISQPRKPPVPLSTSVDETEEFKKADEIKDFSVVDESLLKYLHGYACQRYDDHIVVYFKLET